MDGIRSVAIIGVVAAVIFVIVAGVILLKPGIIRPPEPPGPENKPPVVKIFFPKDGSAASGSVEISGVDYDDSRLASLDVYVDGTSLGGIEKAGRFWYVEWDTAGYSDGPHNIRAVAIDDKGSRTVHEISVAVDSLMTGKPSVSISSPAKGSRVSGTVSITGSASDPGGRVALLEVFIDGESFRAIDSPGSSWNVAWDTRSHADGVAVITAIATDDSGIKDSQSVDVEVANQPANTPPSISITSHSEGSAVSGVVDVSGTASDADGSVSRVDLYASGTLVGTAPNPGGSWSIQWNTMSHANGKATLAAKATDNNGGVAEFSIGLTVSNQQTSLMFEDDQRQASSSISFSAQAGSSKGDISSALAGSVVNRFMSGRMLDVYRNDIGFGKGLYRIDMTGANKEDPGTHTRVHEDEAIVKYVISNGGEVLMNIHGLPNYKQVVNGKTYDYTSLRMQPDNGWGMPSSWEAWQAYVKDVVSYYSPLGVHKYTVWNEPNCCDHWTGPGADMDNYITLYIKGLQAVREADPAAEVFGPATSAFFGKIDGVHLFTSFVSNITAAGERIDTYTHHIYSPIVSREPDPDHVKAIEFLESEFPGIKLSVDEYNEGLPPLTAGERNAAFVGRTVADRILMGYDYMLVFQLYDRDDGAKDDGSFILPSLSIISKYGLKKAAFNTHKQLSMMGSMQVITTISGNPAVNGFATKDPATGSVYVFLASYYNPGESPGPTSAHITISNFPLAGQDIVYRRWVVNESVSNVDHIDQELKDYFDGYSYPLGEVPANLEDWITFHLNNRKHTCAGGPCGREPNDLESFNSRTDVSLFLAKEETFQAGSTLEGLVRLDGYTTVLLEFEPA